MGEFKPFDNDSQSFSVGADEGLTVQNGVDAISIWGEAKFKAGEAGRKNAAALLDVLSAIAAKLPQGPADKALAAKSGSGSLAVSGDLDLAAGKTGRSALETAIAALSAFVAAAPQAAPKSGKAPKS